MVYVICRTLLSLDILSLNLRKTMINFPKLLRSLEKKKITLPEENIRLTEKFQKKNLENLITPEHIVRAFFSASVSNHSIFSFVVKV